MNEVATVFPFNRVDVYVTPSNEKIVEWRLNPDFKFEGSPLVFYIEWAYSGGEWTRINSTSPVSDQCFFIDYQPRTCGTGTKIYYRVVAFDGFTELPSVPANASGGLSNHDWLLARDILRQEYLRLKKYAGTFGWLLRRREHGEKCPSCLDYDIEEPVNTNCGICFGTGYVHGYYTGFPYWVDMSGTTSTKDVMMPRAVVDASVRTVRSVAYPRMETYDIWIDSDKNIRYIIRQVQTAVEIKGIPLVYISEIREVPASGIEYAIPVESPGGSSSSANAQGWRQGIAYQECW